MATSCPPLLLLLGLEPTLWNSTTRSWTSWNRVWKWPSCSVHHPRKGTVISFPSRAVLKLSHGTGRRCNVSWWSFLQRLSSDIEWFWNLLGWILIRTVWQLSLRGSQQGWKPRSHLWPSVPVCLLSPTPGVSTTRSVRPSSRIVISFWLFIVKECIVGKDLKALRSRISCFTFPGPCLAEQPDVNVSGRHLKVIVH